MVDCISDDVLIVNETHLKHEVIGCKLPDQSDSQLCKYRLLQQFSDKDDCSYCLYEQDQDGFKAETGSSVIFVTDWN